MKKTLLFAFALVLLASCSNEDNYNDGASSGEGINFSLYQDNGGETRTQYNTADWLQIDWTLNDQIAIWCDNTLASSSTTSTTRTKGVYKVTDYVKNDASTAIQNQARIAIDGSVANNGSLYWNEGAHDFYATYGEDIQAQVEAGKYNGKFLCTYDVDQTLTKVNGSWSNMKQAYMVARRLNCYPTANVDLHFKCIMTVLEIEIKGMADAPMNLSSVWITIPAGVNRVALDSNDRFEYDYDNGVSMSTSTTDETYKFTWANAEGEIPAGGSIKVIAILPPMSITADQIYVDVKSAGWNSKKVKVNKSVAAGKKARFATANWTFDKTEPIDMGIYGKWAAVNIAVTQNSVSNDNFAAYPTSPGDHLIWGYNNGYAESYYTAASYNINDTGMMRCSVQGWKSNHTNGYRAETSSCPPFDKNVSDLKKNNFDGTAYIDANGNLTDDHDYAYKLLGDTWRMPQYTEFSSMIPNSKLTWVTLNGVTGYLVINKTNGNCLFFGSWGRWGSESSSDSKTFSEGGYYWSATVRTESSNDKKNSKPTKFKKADGWTFLNSDYYQRNIGMQVRAIKR